MDRGSLDRIDQGRDRPILQSLDEEGSVCDSDDLRDSTDLHQLSDHVLKLPQVFYGDREVIDRAILIRGLTINGADVDPRFSESLTNARQEALGIIREDPQFHRPTLSTLSTPRDRDSAYGIIVITVWTVGAVNRHAAT